MDKIIVFGDSLAYGKWDKEGGWAGRLRKYVDEKYNIGRGGNIQVYNLGIPGETIVKMAARVQAELESRLIDPKVKFDSLIIFAIGINDSCPNNWLTEKQTSEDEFKGAMKKMISVAKSAGCEVVFVGLTPVNPGKSKGLKFTNTEVKRYDSLLTEICNKDKVRKIELFDSLMEENFPDLLVDAVHPNSKGHKILLNKILPQLNLSSN